MSDPTLWAVETTAGAFVALANPGEDPRRIVAGERIDTVLRISEIRDASQIPDGYTWDSEVLQGGEHPWPLTIGRFLARDDGSPL